MKEYIFNEKFYIESMINARYVDENNPTYTIKNLARYNFYVLGMDKNQNYNSINEYMKKNCNIYTEVGYQNIINGCIRDAKKKAWANIEEIFITSEELERIKLLNDDRQEKLAFVLLADAKYDDACANKTTHISYLGVSDLYRFSRVTMPIKDRNLFLSFLYSDDLVEENLNPNFSGKKLKYVSENNNNDISLVLNEFNYKELAFTYMNWKYGGYKECKQCGRLFKPKKNMQYCKKCITKTDKNNTKTIRCQECNKEFTVELKNNKTIRCDKCQEKREKELRAERNARYYENHKN